MFSHTIDQIESAYARALTRIGELQEIAEYEQTHNIPNTSTLDALNTATERACTLARMMDVDYDPLFDC